MSTHMIHQAYEYLLDTKFQPLDYINCIEVAHPNLITKVYGSNEQLGNNFNAVNYETTVLAQLTPPQSPPQCSSNNVSSYQLPTPPPTLQIQHQQQLQTQEQQQLQVLCLEEHKNFTDQQLSTEQQLPIVYNVSDANSYNFNIAAWPENNHTVVNNIITNSSNSNHPNVTTTSNVANIEREMQLIDELVNKRAQELSNWHDIDDDCASQSSSIFSATPSQSESNVSNDEDWLPGSGANSSFCYSETSTASSPFHIDAGDHQMATKVNNKYATSSASSSSLPITGATSTQSIAGETASSVLMKRTRMYGRGVEDRKMRKKEQNKNAATRYRQKKKVEMENVLSEEQELLQINEELKRALAERRHEARYLRKLIREFYKDRKL